MFGSISILIFVILSILFSGIQNGGHYAEKKKVAVIATFTTAITAFAAWAFGSYDNEWYRYIPAIVSLITSVTATLLMLFYVIVSSEDRQITGKRIHLIEWFITYPLYILMFCQGFGIFTIFAVAVTGTFLFNIPIQVSVGRPWISHDQGKPEEDFYFMGKRFINLARFNDGYMQLYAAIFSIMMAAASTVYGFNFHL